MTKPTYTVTVKGPVPPAVREKLVEAQAAAVRAAQKRRAMAQ